MTDKLSKLDDDVVRRAAALLAANPAMKATAALRQLGLRSEERITRLRRALVAKPKTLPKQRLNRQKETRQHQTLPPLADLATDVTRQIVERKLSPLSPSPYNLVMSAQFEMWKTMMRWTPLGMLLSKNAGPVQLLLRSKSVRG